MIRHTRLLVASCAMLLGGCASSTRIPPYELPTLLSAKAANPDSSHTVRTDSGDVATISGSIDDVRIVTDKRIETIQKPGSAEIMYARLRINGSAPPNTYAYPMENVSYVIVNSSAEAEGGRTAGGVLLGVGGAGLVAGAGLLIAAQGADRWEAIGYSIYGMIAGGAGLALAIPGAILLGTSSKRSTETAGFRPTLQILPGGAAVTGSF